MQPQQPVSPDPQPTQPTPTPTPPPPAQTPAQPLAPAQSVPGQIPENAAKKIKASATTAIILGILMIIVGVALTVLVDVTAALSILFGVIYLVFGLKLRSPTNSLLQILTSLRTIGITVVVNIIVGLLTGNGVGLIAVLLIFFEATAYKHLFEAGLITSRSPLTAKAK